MSITPAMASEPYWAAAPSRSTCTSLMASSGMAFMSVPVLPRLRAPNRFTSDEVWRRLPFTSTRVWSEPRPRSAAESTRSAPSAPVWRVELNEGEIFVKVCDRSNWPPRSADAASGITSTGDTVSVVELVARREPTTVMTCSDSVDACACGALVCAATFGATVKWRCRKGSTGLPCAVASVRGMSKTRGCSPKAKNDSKRLPPHGTTIKFEVVTILHKYFVYNRTRVELLYAARLALAPVGPLSIPLQIVRRAAKQYEAIVERRAQQTGPAHVGALVQR